MEAINPFNYYYFSHVTKQDYNYAFNIARLKVFKDLKLLLAIAFKIYHIKEDSLRKLVL